MKTERVLALDVSTKTGWAYGISSESGIKLEDYETIPKIHQPEGNYPSNYIIWAYSCFEQISALIIRFKPEVLVIEETSKGSKNAMSQKILEFIHFLLAKYIKDDDITSVYVMTEQWRREIGCKMNDEEKLKNKQVRDYKKAYQEEHGEKTTVAYDINGKRIGLVGRKHVNVRRINEIFEGQLKSALKLKDEDTADSLGLLACYHLRRLKNNGNVEEVSLKEIVEGKI